MRARVLTATLLLDFLLVLDIVIRTSGYMKMPNQGYFPVFGLSGILPTVNINHQNKSL
jgi:hypothetical protein